MPGGLGGSYRSLAGANDVYRSTTTASNGGYAGGGVFETFKKAFSFVSSSPAKDERLLEGSKGSLMHLSRYGTSFAFLFITNTLVVGCSDESFFLVYLLHIFLLSDK